MEEAEKAGRSVWKIYLPSNHAAEAMAEALSIQGYKVGWGKQDFIVGLEGSELDAVVEEVRKHHHLIQIIKIDSDGVEPLPYRRTVRESAKTYLKCWNCGKDGTVFSESYDNIAFRCSACGAHGEKVDYE